MNIDFKKQDGLVPTVVQDASTSEVLMVAYMNAEAWAATLETGFATFWSRSRQKLWRKGESSGHQLVVREVFTDCDDDTILLKVEPRGPGVCHEGYRSCFFRKLQDRQWTIVDEKAFEPGEVYP